MLKKTLQVNELLDYYSDLLTETQHKSLQLYYEYDYSIVEIAEELSISKQAVSLNIKRGESNLYEFEDKLQLVKKSRYDKDFKIYLLKLLDDIEHSKSQEDTINKIHRAKDLIKREEETWHDI